MFISPLALIRAFFLHAPAASISSDTARRQLEAFAYDDQSGRSVPETEVPGSEAKKNGLDDVEMKTSKEGQDKRVFDIGEAVFNAVAKLKMLDFSRQSNTHSV